MKLKIAQVIGLNTDQKAAQVISVAREENFLAVLELFCDDAFTKGRQALSELSDFYFEAGLPDEKELVHFEAEGSSGEKLNAAFKEVEKKFPNEEFSLLLASISGKVLYLIAKGEVEVYLKRESQLSPLASVGGPSQLISGFLSEGDKLLFSTKSLTSFLGEDLEKSLSLSSEEFEIEVTDRIGTSQLENQGLAALFVEVEPDAEENIPGASSLMSETTEKNFSPFSKLGTGIRPALAIVKKIFTNYFPKSGRGRLIIAVILIVIIALGVGFKVKASRDAQIQLEFNQLLQQAKDDFNAAKGLATLNPTEAKNKLESGKTKVNQALKLKPNDSEAESLKKQIEGESGSILQEASVSNFPLFLDMDLVKKNFKATQFSLSDGKLLLLDPTVETLVVIDLAKKSNQILAGQEKLGDAHFASINGGFAYVYSKDKGLLRVDITNQKITEIAKSDSNWTNIQDLYGFASNIYLLDSSQIWKYLPTGDGYSTSREYLTSDTGANSSKADFGSSLRMQIESSVYVLKSGGEILRFTRGVKDNFGLEGLDKGVKEAKSIFVSSDTDNLYVLDSGNSRLLILTKTGQYKGQMSGDKFKTASDLVVDETAKKVYLLEGSKIYTVDLK